MKVCLSSLDSAGDQISIGYGNIEASGNLEINLNRFRFPGLFLKKKGVQLRGVFFPGFWEIFFKNPRKNEKYSC